VIEGNSRTEKQTKARFRVLNVWSSYGIDDALHLLSMGHGYITFLMSKIVPKAAVLREAGQVGCQRVLRGRGAEGQNVCY
jgi:hypothetical protein